MILTDEIIDRAHAAFVEVLRLYGEAYLRVRSDAAHAPLGTGHAVFAGAEMPLTQVGGFAHRVPNDPAVIEAFYEGKTEDWEVAITPFTDGDTVRSLLAMGYRFGEFEGILGQKIASAPEVEQEIVEDDALWLEANIRAWDDNEGPSFEPGDLSRATVTIPMRRYVALVKGVPAACAAMVEVGEAVVLMGGATRFPFRERGLQTALLARRLHDAGVGRLACMGAMPGTQSYRNAQRAGFVPMYSTVTLMRR